MEHLSALKRRLAREEVRLHIALSDSEKEMRSVWISQIKKEIEAEVKFLAKNKLPDLTDDELLAELMK
jgi:hypothetical protein